MSKFFGNRLLGMQALLMDEAGGDKGGKGGAGAGEGDKDKPDLAKDVSELRSMNQKLLERLDAMEKAGGKGAAADDDDLASKAKAKRELEEKNAGGQKAMESALKFTLGSPQWLKDNTSLLPKNIPEIFAAAEKENYGSAVEKASAIKVGVVSEFFAQQENLDLLTESQKSALEDFKKLTKTDKQERIQAIYDSIFEPTFEMKKKIAKAEQVRKGHNNSTDAESAYKKKLLDGSRKHYLGDKQNA